MKYTQADIIKGAKFWAHLQSTTISGYSMSVVVVWVDDKTVGYVLDGGIVVRETPIDRFLWIINQKVKRHE